MTIEKFLIFWSSHNTLIIEVLVAIILGMILLIGYLSFFGKNQMSETALDGLNVPSGELQIVLKKLIENASGTKSGSDISNEARANSGAVTDGAGKEALEAANLQAMTANLELTQIKKDFQEREAELNQLKAQLQEAQENLQKAATVPSEANSSSSSVPVASADEMAEAKKKISELEQRLAEYEIISEDIADISRYKDENQKLKQEIESLRSKEGQDVNISDDVMKEFSEAVEKQKQLEEAQLAEVNGQAKTGESA